MDNDERGSYHTDKVIISTDSDKQIELSKTNPYVVDDTESNSNKLLIRTHYYIPDDLVVRAMQLEKKTCFVRVVCLFDLILNAGYAHNNWVLALILCSVSFAGFMSTVYYKRSLLCAYMVYQYFLTSVKFSNIIYYVIVLNDASYHTIVIIDTGIPSINIFILSVLCVIQMFIAYFVTEYYQLLPSASERERIRSSSI